MVERILEEKSSDTISGNFIRPMLIFSCHNHVLQQKKLSRKLFFIIFLKFYSNTSIETLSWNKKKK